MKSRSSGVESTSYEVQANIQNKNCIQQYRISAYENVNEHVCELKGKKNVVEYFYGINLPLLRQRDGVRRWYKVEKMGHAVFS